MSRGKSLVTSEPIKKMILKTQSFQKKCIKTPGQNKEWNKTYN